VIEVWDGVTTRMIAAESLEAALSEAVVLAFRPSWWIEQKPAEDSATIVYRR
jgi:hypothetical protein